MHGYEFDPEIAAQLRPWSVLNALKQLQIRKG